MKGYGVTFAEVEAAAATVGLLAIGGDIPGDARRTYGVSRDRCSFRLALGDERREDGSRPYQRVSASAFQTRADGERRRIAAVCWHGHRDALRAIFRHNPEARVVSAFADYNGAGDFEASFEETGDRNVGSMIYPCAMRDACSCSEYGLDLDRHADDGDHGYPIEFRTLDPSGDSLAVVESRTILSTSIAACPFVIFDPRHYDAEGRCRCSDPEERARLIREADYTEADFKRAGVLA